jgi:hypothetical protein
MALGGLAQVAAAFIAWVTTPSSSDEHATND